MAGRPEAFFLPTAAGARFCLYHEPHHRDNGLRGAILYVHPFAEEMNKSRRMAAEQARRFCRLGWAVLQIDLTGCGDSEGDFGDATWRLWLADLAAAWHWLGERTGAQEHERWLWGVRLGGLLAAAFAGQCSPDAHGLLLWQPVLSGAQHLNQFLRLRTISGALTGAAAENARSLRAELDAGRCLEIAGYTISPELAVSMQSAELGTMHPIPACVHWLDVAGQSTEPSPAARRVSDAWGARGVHVNHSVVQGTAFWQTQEIEMCPSLLEATETAFAPLAAAA